VPEGVGDIERNREKREERGEWNRVKMEESMRDTQRGHCRKKKRGNRGEERARERGGEKEKKEKRRGRGGAGGCRVWELGCRV